MKYTTQELVDEINRVAENVGRAPTLQDMRDEGKHSATTYYNRFGSWKEALIAAGYEAREPEKEAPVDELLSEIGRLADEYGHAPSAKEMNEDGEYWASTYCRRFGSWNDAIRESGHEPTPESTQISDDELLAEVQRLAEELGSLPSFNDMAEHGKYAPQTYVRHFGSWNAAINKADDDE